MSDLALVQKLTRERDESRKQRDEALAQLHFIEAKLEGFAKRFGCKPGEAKLVAMAQPLGGKDLVVGELELDVPEGVSNQVLGQTLTAMCTTAATAYERGLRIYIEAEKTEKAKQAETPKEVAPHG